MNIWDYDCLGLHALICSGEITAAEVLHLTKERLVALEPSIKAFSYLNMEGAFKAAHALDAAIRIGQKPPALAGIPYALKANMATLQEPTDACSKVLQGFRPSYTAAVAESLAKAGAICVGKSNMDALAMGSSTMTSCFGPSYNPWGENLSPGGSSGGAAAAVAAKEVWFALGSDTGGSIRQPAAFCGVVGMKPTFGLVSSFGVIPLAPTFDQVGPITSTVRDCAAIMHAISQKDLGFMQKTTPAMRGMKIAIVKEYMQLASSEMVDALYNALNIYAKECGTIIEEISLPLTKYALPAYHVIAPAAFAHLLLEEDYAACPGFVAQVKAYDSALFGTEERRRILMGSYFNSALDAKGHYEAACKIRLRIRDELQAALQNYDCIITPTTCNTAFRYDAMPEDGAEMYKNDMLLAAASISGLPAVSLPCGKIHGLPASMQIIGKNYEDSKILHIAQAYETATAGEYICS